MIALYIVLSIALFLLLLLLFPIDIIVNYTETFIISVKFFFVKIQLYPSKKKKTEKEKKPKEQGKKQEKPKKSTKDSILEIIHATGVKGFLDVIYKIVKLLMTEGYGFLKHLKLVNPDIYMCVGSDNAADTALNYGKYSSALYPAVGFIYNYFGCKNGRITVDYDYEKNNIEIVASTIIRFNLLFLLNTGLRIVCKGLPLLFKLRTNKTKGRKKQK